MAKKTNRSGETEGRLSAFFDRLDALGLAGAVLDRRDDIFYYTGYTGSDAVALLSARARKGWLITDSRYTEEAEKTAPGMETVLWRGEFAPFVGRHIRSLRLGKMGFTPTTMTVRFFEGMRGDAPAVKEWRNVDDAISAQRAVKSAAEIALVKKALDCAQESFLVAKKRWKPGMTEVEIKNDIEWEMRKRGAEDAAFETIAAIGPNASLPHAHSGNRNITPGKMLLLDFGARLGRYNSDLTRTMWCREVPKVWLKRYQSVLEAQQAGFAAIRAGVPGTIPDAEARRVFAASGIDRYFTHGLGHGFGLAVHEDPRLSARADRLLEAGNLVTVEPGVYFPGSGGIRVEDMVLVEKSGGRILSSLPKDIESIVF